MNRQPSKRKSRGQALVEFALVLPILVLLVFGAVDLGRLFFSLITITNAARVGARYATTNEVSHILDTTNCSSMSTCWTNVNSRIRQWVFDEAKNSGINLEDAYTRGIAQVSISYPDGRAQLKPVVVSVDYRFDLVLQFLFPSINLQRQVQMRIP